MAEDKKKTKSAKREARRRSGFAYTITYPEETFKPIPGMTFCNICNREFKYASALDMHCRTNQQHFQKVLEMARTKRK